MSYVLTLKCEAGHEQKIVFDRVSKDFVVEMGQLLDGTWPHYKYPPREFPMAGSVVGKCSICGAWISSSVEEEAKPAE